MSHRKLVLVGAAVALLVTGAGVAVASGVTLPFSGDGNTINGCYASGGTLRVLTPAQPLCPDGFSPIHWNVTGPRGPQGPQGAQGQQGPAGTAGDVYTTYGERSTPSGNLFDVDTIAYLVLPPGTYELSRRSTQRL
jgi:hypothetical protein